MALALRAIPRARTAPFGGRPADPLFLAARQRAVGAAAVAGAAPVARLSAEEAARSGGRLVPRNHAPGGVVQESMRVKYRSTRRSRPWWRPALPVVAGDDLPQKDRGRRPGEHAASPPRKRR